MDIGLSGKRVLVTGGNSGLGAAMVRAFAAAGSRVAINYVAGPEEAHAIARAVQEEEGDALVIQGDVSDPDAVENMFGHLDSTWGGVDVLVNNAGIDGPRGLAWETDVAAWRRVLDVNVVGAFLCARQALHRMVKQRAGVILNTSSVHEVIPWSGYSAYAASKAALSMLARTLAQEAGPHGVRVLCIAPGAVQTPINARVWQNPEGLRDLIRKIPLGRMGQPADIAAMAVILASDVAAYMTGTTVFVDGGMTDYADFMHGG